MARKFKTVDYAQAGQQRLTIGDYLPADHLARFIVAIVEMLDLLFLCVLCGGGW
jgi:hypothetical protein